jgi:hypothetical protein
VGGMVLGGWGWRRVCKMKKINEKKKKKNGNMVMIIIVKTIITVVWTFF